MEAFKNNISAELTGIIADHLGRHLPGFDRTGFVDRIMLALPEQELKARAQTIADAMHEVLPADLTKRNQVLVAMLHPDHEPGQSDGRGIRGWGMFPLGMVVGQHGLVDFDGSMETLRKMTRCFSSEFDVRYFLTSDLDRGLAIMSRWLTDKDEHVRRLVSEGTRPRLPWGMQLRSLVADPTPTLPLLMALRDDPSEYVRRSVANHLNDIAKDHPDLVANIAADWMQGADKDRVRLLRHACRTLIKQGNKEVLSVFGFAPPKLENARFDLYTPSVIFGEALEFSLSLSSVTAQDQHLMIEYIIHHQKANGSLSPKVFKWKTATLPAKSVLNASRRHTIKKITTRAYYPGLHRVEISVNGQVVAGADFELLMP